ncbi:MAG: Peptidase S26 [bacterium ADurb.BinA186]|nr:MAG: Peptidase S26 [bacterium ADurb.BinA186]
MNKQKTFRKSWAIFTVIALICLPSLQFFDQIIFLNKTASMPIGIYIKNSTDKLKIGDIIVFYSKETKSNLLKYIAGYEGDEYCLDFENTLWVNNFPLAQKNIAKYHEEMPTQSLCQILKKEELLVLGEHPDSYDSRYFGPIKKQQVIAQVELALEWKND